MKFGKFLVPLIALSLTACSAEKRQFSITDSYVPVIGSGSQTEEFSSNVEASTVSPGSSGSEGTNVSTPPPNIQTGLIREQILDGEEGEIHYSYYLPESYDGTREYSMMVTMPGYDRMWFGEDSSGNNIDWNGFRTWTELDEEMIVISAQLTDWHEKSARQANELARYFIDSFAVDTDRIYAAGYSAGGETMSQAVALRPDLYSAYLHGASQWDGEFAPIAENGVAVYIYMAENDEYYGSQKARDAYDGLYSAYRDLGFSDEEIGEKLCLEIPDNEYFNLQGIYNYHGGVNIVFDDKNVLNWVISHTKQE